MKRTPFTLSHESTSIVYRLKQNKYHQNQQHVFIFIRLTKFKYIKKKRVVDFDGICFVLNGIQ